MRDPAELCRLLDLPPSLADRAAGSGFPLLAPRRFVALMRRGDPADPLLRQVLPLAEERVDVPGFTADPLGEADARPVPGLLHKYHGRALLVVTGACAVHCRYCFRRHYPYGDRPRGDRWWRAAHDHVAADPTIRELILSGGDPLTLPDQALAELIAAFAEIPHLQRLRVHSRLPVVLPDRLDDRLLAVLSGSRLSAVMVIHANHPTEIAVDVVEACRRVRAAGITLLNQSVLLAGVNDDAAVLAALSERLWEAGVLPYYLHCLDRVAGAAHFRIDPERAHGLHRELAARLPGYLVPRLVREEAGAPGKTVIA